MKWNKDIERRLYFHVTCVSIIVFIQLLVIGLILVSNKELFIGITDQGSPYLVPVLVALSGLFTVAVYI